MAAKKKITFEEGLETLEQLVARLEEGKLSLEEAMKVYEEGKKLGASLSAMLETGEKKLQVLEEEKTDDEL